MTYSTTIQNRQNNTAVPSGRDGISKRKTAGTERLTSFHPTIGFTSSLDSSSHFVSSQRSQRYPYNTGSSNDTKTSISKSFAQITNNFSFRRRIKGRSIHSSSTPRKRRNTHRRYTPNTYLVWSCVILTTSLVLLIVSLKMRRPSPGDQLDDIVRIHTATSHFTIPSTTTIQLLHRSTLSMQFPTVPIFWSGPKDFGGLHIEFPSEGEPLQREIDDAEEEWFLQNDGVRDPYAPMEDDFDPDFVPHEDDYLRYWKDYTDGHNDDAISPGIKHHPMRKGTIGCRRVAIHSLLFPICNNFHELTILNPDLKILGHGDFRQAASVSVPFGSSTEHTVYKHIRYDEDFDYHDMEYMRRDTLVAALLTPSPRIFKTYGLCGIASLSEYAMHGTIEDDVYGPDEDERDPTMEKKAEDWEPVNDLYNIQKVRYALQMAEAVADLHGFHSGVIIHEDIKLDQFLWNEDKSLIKLNDFSRAVFMMWHDKDQLYCAQDEEEYREFRSPEEYEWSRRLTEKIDVYNLAIVFFTLLTGHFITDREAKQDWERVKEGGSLRLDPRYTTRSKVDAKFVDIIARCQAFQPDDRPSIFELIVELKEMLDMAIEEEREKI
ncbi:phospholipid-translocating P-type ATPase, flippase [Nitzschia inconspicua]|uniref:Phospholipid-translocating P-type ATPase, flippase n=1 Tax=Nitzschia inconspicua TaxID=303405 RepID=A0A9K3LSV6_9STRA|nr:phospholipid-translocating P-type ATPase, flippase [Nitzschia inconspicua]KAG7365956.1 phospholipid-translocating P-type ATPase, flippase [Nitzschia inconspicua]